MQVQMLSQDKKFTFEECTQSVTNVACTRGSYYLLNGFQRDGLNFKARTGNIHATIFSLGIVIFESGIK